MKYIKYLLSLLIFVNIAVAEFGDEVKLDSSTRIDIGDHFNQVQDGAPFYGGTSTGAANTYDLQFSAANEPDQLSNGMRLNFIAHQTNTGNVTIEIGSLSDSLLLTDGSTQVPASTIISGDFVDIIYDGSNFRLLSLNNGSPRLANLETGWVALTEAWTYASATTITVPTGATNRFQKGDKLRLTNSTVKYFYITNVAATTLTVTGGSDYSLTNTTISNASLSRASSPFGFPRKFSFTNATVAKSGGSGTLASSTLSDYSFSMESGVLHISLYLRIDIDTNTITGINLQLPVSAAAIGVGQNSALFNYQDMATTNYPAQALVANGDSTAVLIRSGGALAVNANNSWFLGVFSVKY